MSDSGSPQGLQVEDLPALSVDSLFRLDGTVAVVTGASSGLGRRFARVLDAAGAVVVGAARRMERLEALASTHPQMIPLRCDVSVPGDRERLIDVAQQAAADTGKQFSLLINNAGIGITKPALEETLEEFDTVMDTNVTALFHLSQLAAQHFIVNGGGAIVNVASMLGLVASAPINQAGYVASKSAVVGLTRELGCQWARKGVRVNALAPGWFESEMTDEKMFGDERAMAFLERNCPMARGGQEDELDGALLLLASRAGSYITGQTITVDGGWTAR